MPYVEFNSIEDLRPSAFKLYVFFLHRVQQTGSDTVEMSLADLAFWSGLQAQGTWRTPGQSHGRDGRIRLALAELVEKGLIEKRGSRGRRPNTYRILCLHSSA